MAKTWVNSNPTNVLLALPEDETSEESDSSLTTMSGHGFQFNKKNRGNRARQRRVQEEYQAQYMGDTESSQNSSWGQSQYDESLVEEEDTSIHTLTKTIICGMNIQNCFSM